MQTEEKAWQIYFRLLERYGEPERRRNRDAVDSLIQTILSANTNDVNSGRAFDELVRRYRHDWEAIRAAPLDEIKDAIRVAGMYNQKAPRIVAALDRIKSERGEYNIDFLADMPVDEALAYLTSFSGIGKKTASIVLLFVFNLPAFPVDTHIQRISQRTGISSLRASPDKVMAAWEQNLTGDTYYRLHVNLITHGRDTCHARTPKCEQCVLRDLCDFYTKAGDWME